MTRNTGLRNAAAGDVAGLAGGTAGADARIMDTDDDSSKISRARALYVEATTRRERDEVARYELKLSKASPGARPAALRALEASRTELARLEREFSEMFDRVSSLDLAERILGEKPSRFQPKTPMFLLLLKTEGNGMTTLNFVGMYGSRAEAERHVGEEFGPFRESGHGNRRMLEACDGKPLVSVLTTQLSQGSSYLLAEY